jgi:phytoene synthase
MSTSTASSASHGSGALSRRSSAPQAEIAAVIVRHSRSFALASKLLPRQARHAAVVLYAYCRRADDAIDCSEPSEQPHALNMLRAELDDIYAGRIPRDELLRASAELVQARAVPRAYLDELLNGMEMDVRGERYQSVPDLLRYCYRVAGTVGTMMCHALGVRRGQALVHAAHLGIAMQLTNIARDVLDDWELGRLYLPDELLARHGAPGLADKLGEPLPPSALPAVARTVGDLLDLAEVYYRSGDAGMRELSLRCAFAVRVARLVYAEIGSVLRARGCNPIAPRAVVSGARKLWLVARAFGATVLSAVPCAFRTRTRIPGGPLELEDAIALLPGGERSQA